MLIAVVARALHRAFRRVVWLPCRGLDARWHPFRRRADTPPAFAAGPAADGSLAAEHVFADYARRAGCAVPRDRRGDYVACRVAVMRGLRVMRVLGVDPGLTRCGLGVVDGKPGSALTLVDGGVVRTGAGDGIAPRLLALEREIERWLSEYRPDAVAVERVFSQHNVRTVMGTAQAGAVAIVAAARRGLPVATYTPSEVKAAVTGSGRADKAQMTVMVTRLLRMADPPRPADAADALGLAICHIWRGGARLRIAAAVADAGRPSPASPGPAGPVLAPGGVR